MTARVQIWQAEIHGTGLHLTGGPLRTPETDPGAPPEAAAGITVMTGAAAMTAAAVMAVTAIMTAAGTAAAAITAIREAGVRPAFPSK